MVAQKLHDEVIAILNTSDMKQRITTLGFDLIAAGPGEFAKQLKDDVERWRPVVKAAGAEQP